MRAFRKPLNSVLVKPAGPDCNMACRYCFYLDKAAMFPAAGARRMDGAVLEALVRQVMTDGEPVVSFGWQGGEPTLMGVEFFERVIELEKRWGRAGQTVANGLQTNGLRIDDAWCRVLRSASFLVGLSIDGPRHIHDHYRIAAGGQGTWQRVVETSRRLLDAGVEVNALSVVSDYSARFAREIYEFHKHNGMTFMQFIPCVEPDPGHPGRAMPFSVGAEQFGRFLCELFDCWTADVQDGRATTSVRWFESVVATYAGLSPPECTLMSECGTYVVIEHNGDVFACDFFVEDRWRLGNVRCGRLIEMLNSPRQAEFGRRKAALPHDCQQCRWLRHCRGGCPKERWGHPADARLSYLCEAYKMFFSHADGWLRETARRLQRERADRALPGRTQPQVGRNDPCPCGSGLKYKRCCGAKKRA